MYKLLTVITLLALLYGIQSCKNKKVFKKQYYPSGKLKSKGWYIRDTIPVDTIFYYYENGNFSSVENRNDLGYLHGESRFYYENGKLQVVDNYQNNYLHGFSYEYDRNGNLTGKIFHLNDKQSGDCYWYNSDGYTVRKYSFFDFEENNRILIEYDNTGKIMKDLRPIMFVDSISTYTDSIYTYVDTLAKTNERFYDLMILASNPPKCKTVVTIDYLKNSELMWRDSIVNKQYYFYKGKFSDDITHIKFIGVQYDSINKKELYHTEGLVFEK